MKMDYYRALDVADSNDPHLHIDEVLQALTTLADAARKYRALYEGALKHIDLLRDVAAKPDIFVKPWEDDDEQHRSEVSEGCEGAD